MVFAAYNLSVAETGQPVPAEFILLLMLTGLCTMVFRHVWATKRMKAVKIPEVLSYRSRCKGEYWIEQVGVLLILALCLISTFFIFLGIVFVFWIKKIRRQRFALTPLLVLRRFGLDSLDAIGRFVQVYAFYVGEVRTVIEPGVKVMQVRGKPVSGIEFVRLPEHSWKQGVQREMQGAVAIIIDLSEPTEAVQWELNCDPE